MKLLLKLYKMGANTSSVNKDVIEHYKRIEKEYDCIYEFLNRGDHSCINDESYYTLKKLEKELGNNKKERKCINDFIVTGKDTCGLSDDYSLLKKIKKQMIRKENIVNQLASLKKFYLFENVYGRNIIILGERHVGSDCNSGENLKPSEWVMNLAKEASKKGKCIDLFIEDSYEVFESKKTGEKSTVKYVDYGEGSKPGMDYLMDNKNKLAETNSVRYHYSDPRELLKGRSYLNEIEDFFVKNTDKDIEREINDYLTQDKIRNVLKSFITGDTDVYVDFILHIINTVDIFDLRKEYPDYDYGSISFKDTIKTYFININRIIYKQYKKTDPNINFIDTLINIYTDQIFSNTYVSTKISEFSTYIMDIYLLLRLFKTFDTKQQTTVTNCQNVDKAKNAIIYCGAFHATIYYKLLNNLGFKPKIEHNTEKEDNDYCIKFKEPFDYELQ